MEWKFSCASFKTKFMDISCVPIWNLVLKGTELTFTWIKNPKIILVKFQVMLYCRKLEWWLKWTIWYGKSKIRRFHSSCRVPIPIWSIYLVMIQSSSKAIFDTIKSIMSFNCTNTRSLIPQDYSKEIFLSFNLWPLHSLDGLIENTKSKMRK